MYVGVAGGEGGEGGVQQNHIVGPGWKWKCGQVMSCV